MHLKFQAFSTPEKFGEGHPEILAYPIIRSSDAHVIADIGSASTLFYLNEASFDEIRQGLKGQNGRKVMAE